MLSASWNLLEEGNPATMAEGGFTDAIGIHAMRWEGNVPVLPHRHNYLELAMLARGSCLHAWQGLEVRLVPGDLFVVLPGESHAYRIEGDTVIYNCLFYPSALGSDWEALHSEPSLRQMLAHVPSSNGKTFRQQILHLGRTELEQMERIWTDMVLECRDKPMGHATARKALLLQMLVHIARIWHSGHAATPEGCDTRRNLLVQAIETIDRRAAQSISLDALASECHVSPGHFRKLFHELTGLSPTEYINRRRVAMAQELLRNQDLLVAEVAEAVGMPDANYFTRLFRRLVGETPSRYRKHFHLQ